jgi:hypothetical protein
VSRINPLEFRLLQVIEFADDCDIKRENVWIDPATIRLPRCRPAIRVLCRPPA